MRLDSRASLACPEFLHKIYAPNRFDLSNLAAETPMAKAMSEQGFIHEARAVSKLVGSIRNHVVVDQDLPTEVRETETVDALRNKSVQLIINPVLGETAEKLICTEIGNAWSPDQTRNSRPDLLIRISSEPGAFGTWAAVDIKSHGAFDKDNKSNQVFLAPVLDGSFTPWDATIGRLKEDDALQLAHYQRHLESIGIANLDSWAGIIGRDLNVIAWAKLGETKFGRGKSALSALAKYDLQFNEALRIAETAQLRNHNPDVVAPVIPMLESDPKKCPTCSFLPICLNEMVAYKGTGNVTLLATVTPSKARDDLPSGISIGELADLDEQLNAFGEEAKQRARVYLSGVPEVKRGVSGFTVPTFDIEIDIDLENSQGALQEIGFDESVEPDRLYLYGYVNHDRTVSLDWRSSPANTFEDYSGTREGEHSVYLRMWNYLQEQINQAQDAGKTIGIFHYSSHELTWWRKWVNEFSDLPGTPNTNEMEDFIDRYMNDLYPVAQQIVFPPNSKSPICNYSIKTLAPLAGFNWHADDAGGANSLLKYKEATGSDELKAVEAQNWLRNYNIDDVKATMALRNWLRDLNF
jgi:predicted RecB family nuclease